MYNTINKSKIEEKKKHLQTNTHPFVHIQDEIAVPFAEEKLKATNEKMQPYIPNGMKNDSFENVFKRDKQEEEEKSMYQAKVISVLFKRIILHFYSKFFLSTPTSTLYRYPARSMALPIHRNLYWCKLSNFSRFFFFFSFPFRFYSSLWTVPRFVLAQINWSE